MRVPIFQQQVVTGGLPGAQPVQTRAVDNTQALQAIGEAGASVDSAVAATRAEADALRLTNSMTELERRANKRLLGEKLDNPIDAAFEGSEYRPGYLSTRGLEALKESSAVMDGLHGDVDDIAGQLTEEQRNAFKARADSFLVEAEKRVQGHQAQEFQRAKDIGAKDRQDEALRSIGADPLGPTVPFVAASVEADIERVFASDPAHAEAQKAEFRGKMAATQISAFLSMGDVTHAEERFEETKQWLGTAAPEVRARIDRAKEGAKKDELSVAATKQVKAWLEEVRPKGGYASAADLAAKLQATPADDPRFDDLEREVRQQMQVESERRRADTQKHREFAWRADLDGKEMPGASFAFLKEFDPDFLRGLRNEREARWKRLQVEQDGTKADRAAAKAQQTQDDMVLFYEYAALSPEEQAKKSPEEFAAELAADRPDFSPSAGAIAKTRAHQTQTAQRQAKGDLTDEQRFIEKAKSQVVAQVTRKGKLDPQFKDVDVRTVAGGRAAEFFRSERAKLGRDPTPAETEQWLGQLKVQEVYESGLLGDKKGPAVLAPKFMPGGFGAPLPANPAPAKPGQKSKRQAAEEWLSKNPTHPNAAAVRAKLEKMQ